MVYKILQEELYHFDNSIGNRLPIEIDTTLHNRKCVGWHFSEKRYYAKFKIQFGIVHSS